MAGLRALVLIYDIRGFTSASRRMTTTDLGAFATGAHRAILDLFAERPPTFVKNLGDGHLVLWETTDPADPALVSFVVAGAAKARTAFAGFVAGHGAANPLLPRRVGIGVAYGEVSRSDDYYGVALNLAARLQNLARPEGLALDQSVFDSAAARDVALRGALTKSRVRLKGLGSTVVWVDRPFSWGRLFRAFAMPLAVLALPILYLGLAAAGNDVPGGDAVRAFYDRVGFTFLRPVASDEAVRATARDVRSRLGEKLLSVRTEQGWIRAEFKQGSTYEFDLWSSSQAICALMRWPEAPTERLRETLGGLRAPFEPGQMIEVDGTSYGWLAHPDVGYTEAEPCLWTMAALALALGRGDVVPASERPQFLENLARTQRAALTYRPLETGAWNIFPRQVDPSIHSPYATSLALLALLETRKAGLPFLGSVERRDAMLASTVRFVDSTFTAAGGRVGWRRTGDANDPVSLGLTLQNFALLLRAEKEAGLPLSDRVAEAMPESLEDLVGISIEQSADAGEFKLKFTAHDGRIEVRSEGINFLWHPWAVEASQRWLEREAPMDAADRVRVRRTLGHLVVALADKVLATVPVGYVFVTSETVYAFSAVPPPAR